MNPILIVALVAALAVFILFFGLARVIGGGDKAVDKRLDRYAARADKKEETKKEKANRLVQDVDEVLTKRGFAANLATELARADVKLTVTEFLILSGLCVVALFVIGMIVLGGPVFGLLLGVLGFFLPRVYLRIRQGRRLKAFNDQLADSVMLLANSLRSGYSLLQSMDTVSKQLSPPISTEFARVVREIGLGIPNETAFQNLLRRIDSDDLDLMITAINVQHEVGGNLAEILDKIGHIIRERIRIKGEIKTLTAMQRASAYIVTSLPVIMAVIISIINPDYMSTLWTTLCGWIMLAVSFIMLVSGFLVIRKIVDIEV
jgi:tight adherence protein B